MQDATQPVVLAPASAAHAHAEVGKAKAKQATPLVRFGIVRSYANSLVAAKSDSSPSSPAAAVTAPRREGEIWSFRSIFVDVSEIDVQTDGEFFLHGRKSRACTVPAELLLAAADGFLEAVLTFVVALPVADIWQVGPLPAV
jgi:hypothetical protein